MAINFSGTSVVAVTAGGGAYSYMFQDCSTHSYSASAYAVAYHRSGFSNASAQPGKTSFSNFALLLWSTWNVMHAFYNLSAGPTQNLSIVSNTNVNAASAASIGPLTSQTWPPIPPSNDSHVYYITGDVSGGPTSQLIADFPHPKSPLLSNGPSIVALSGPLWLTFSIFVPDSTHATYSSNSQSFAVDANMSGSNELDAETDYNRAPIYSSQVDNCWAADMSYVVDQWHTVYCDLTGLEGVSISNFQLVYHNDFGVSGQITAFFDNIRLVEPYEQQTIVNGGFETAALPYSWLNTGAVAVTTSISGEDGNHSLRVGYTTAPQGSGCGDTCSFYKSAAWQILRVPDANLTSPLTFSIMVLASSCNSLCNSSFGVELIDHTTNSNKYVDLSQWTSNWATVTYPLSGYYGHIVTVQLYVNQWGSEAAFVYFDDVQILAQGSALTESGSFSLGKVAGTMHLAGSTYRPACNGADTVWELPESFSTTIHHWQSYFAGSGSQRQQYWVDGNVTLTANVLNYTNECRTGGYDQLLLATTLAANSTRGAPGGQHITIYDACIWAQLSQSGASVPTPTFSPLKAANLTNGGATAGPIAPTDWWIDALAIGITVTLEVALGVVTDGAALPIIFANAFLQEVILHSVLSLVFGLPFSLTGWAAPVTTCQHAPTGSVSSSWTGVWDSTGEGPSQVLELGSLAVDVGRTQTNVGGGTYAINIEMTADYCQYYASQECESNGTLGQLFDTISTSYALTVITT